MKTVIIIDILLFLLVIKYFIDIYSYLKVLKSRPELMEHYLKSKNIKL
jgi:hypothetical protein